jgi:mannose-1-phosphate guanylyltransferase/mannose-6-phosphate isomerase
MKVIILAGGGGTRLFPLSRTRFPKQFFKLYGETSLLAQTIKRFLPIVAETDMIIVTNQEFIHHVKNELAVANGEGAHILVEPVARNTAPAMALAARYCIEQLGCGLDEVVVVSPSDHVVFSPEKFAVTIGQAAELAALDKVVTLGVLPDGPETEYGYIQTGGHLGPGFAVEAFKEKPDKETTSHFLAKGSTYWNTGIFAFTLSRVMAEFREHQPELFKLADVGFAQMVSHFTQMPDISFDYGVVEKSRQVAMVRLDSKWRDIESWDAVYEVLGKDPAGNAIKGDCIVMECKNTLLLGDSRLLVGIGLEDLLVVETDDVILVAEKGQSAKIRELVANLKSKGRPEVDEHTTVYRPWGFYTVLSGGPGYKMKKIVVNPGEILSLQLHYHRSEHWIIIGGTAQVTIGETQTMVHENQSVFIPQTTKHRIANPGKLPLEIIEVQNGSYLGEDDIVRFEDRYGRS